jgi:hypothetical protein
MYFESWENWDFNVYRDGETEILGIISRGCKRKIDAQGENPRVHYQQKN